MDTLTSATSTRRWFGVGHSISDDPAVAGAEAAAVALAGRPASLLLVFGSITYDLPPLLDAIRAVAGPGVPIVGCSSMGEIGHRGAVDDSVAVVALGGPGFQVSTRVSRGASTRRHESGMEVAGSLAGVDRPYRTLVLLCDGLTMEHHEIVRGAYSVAGATVPLIGGCAADNVTYTGTYQFYGDDAGVEIMSDAVIGIALGSDAPIGIGMAHGWHKIGDAMVVTSSDEGRLYELDCEPALDVYLRRIGQDRSIIEIPEKFQSAAFNHPLGLSRRDGEDIRVVHNGNLVDGSLTCLANLPQGALTWLMETDPDSIINAAGDSCAQAVQMLDGAAPLGLLIFDCGVRKVMLGYDGIRAEMAEILRVVGDTPVGGCYTFGEIARTQGSRGMHHQTFATLALA